MTEILRKLSIKRRMVLFFCLLCLFPILLLLCFSGWSGRYQAENGEQRFTNMYLEQGQNQLNAYLEEYEQKVRYLTENPDLLADVYLYHENCGYRGETTASRIESILYHACREEAFFDYGIILSEDGSVFLKGQDMEAEASYFQKLMESEGEKITANKPVFLTGEDGNVYLAGLLRPGLEPKQITCYLILRCNMDAFGEIVTLLKRTQEQRFSLMGEEGQVLFSDAEAAVEAEAADDAEATDEAEAANDAEAADDAELSDETKTSVDAAAPEAVDTIRLRNGWKLTISGDTISSKNPFGIQGLLALILLLFSAACMYLLAKSLTIPLGQIMEKMYRAGLKGDTQEATEEKSTAVPSGDEHHMLEQKLTEMIGKQRELRDKMYMSRIGEEKIQMRIKELELNAMQQQINPHFLLNVLETIYWMAEEKGYEQTEEMIAVLGDYFKLCVSTAGEFVTIREEIENAKSYLQILAILYEKNFEVQWETDPDILDARTIKLILQPVIENAFEHGIRSMKQGGRIRITGRRTEHGVEFWVEDNGRGMTEERLKEVTDYMKDSNYDPARSVGTKNVNLRIRLYYGEAYGLSYESKEGMGTRAVIRIPWETGAGTQGENVIRS